MKPIRGNTKAKQGMPIDGVGRVLTETGMVWEITPPEINDKARSVKQQFVQPQPSVAGRGP